MTQQYKQQIISGAKNYNLTLEENTIDLLLAYHQLLIKWNKAFNLTSVRDPLAMISRHLIDSMSIAPYLKGQNFIDVGSGGGLPGIVLAIIFPERNFDLLDSNGKKTRFLFQVKTELKLSNINVHHCRVENYQSETLYDGVLSRAFATLLDMVSSSHQLLAKKGFFYAMKGIYPKQELSDVEKNYKVVDCHSLIVAGDQAERHLVLISKKP